VPDGSVVDLFVELEREVEVADIHRAIATAAATPALQGILQYLDRPVVSSDIIGNAHSSIYDPGFTTVTGGRFVKTLNWYDNEWGYSNRVCDLIAIIGQW
jgi:glyceraldehyde 3-phosphate dehydrogenase